MNIKLGSLAFFLSLFMMLNFSLSAMDREEEKASSSQKIIQKKEASPKKIRDKQEKIQDRNPSQNKNEGLPKRGVLKENPKTLFESFEQLEPFGAVRYRGILTHLKDKGVFKRFEAIDGPLYEQNKTLVQKLFARKETFQTSTRSGHVFRSRNIPPPKDRKDNILQGDTFDPDMALKELAALCSQYTKEEITKIKLLEGKGNSLVSRLLGRKKEDINEEAALKIIRDLNLSFYPPYQQKMILESIEGLEPEELSLRFSPLVTFSYLKEIKLRDLQVLDLRGCEEMSESLLLLLSAESPPLRELNFSRIKNLRRCVIKRDGKSHPLSFPHLEHLSMSGCENLEEIRLRASSLKQLRANRCGKLRAVDVEAPNLTFLSVLETPQLPEEGLDGTLMVERKFPELRYEKLKGKRHKEALRAHEIDPQLSVWFLYRYPEVTQQVIRQETKLVSMDLAGMGINDKSCQLLAKGLEKNTTLTALYFGVNGIGAEGAKALATGNLSALTSLDLSRNYIRDKGAKALATGNLSALTTLSLSYNSIGVEGTKALASGNLSALTTLNLDDNSIGDEGAKALASGNLSALTELNLDGNSIGDEGAKALAFGNLSALTTLNLERNNIGDEGAKAFASGNLSALTTLNLDDNSIGDEGAKALTSGNLSALTTLNLRSNSIGAEGAKALAFVNFSALITLNLYRNSIGDEGREGLAKNVRLSVTY